MLYVFHFFFVVFAANWITISLVDVWWSYPLSWTVTVVFTAVMNGLLYAVLLRFKTTRFIFGLRQFDPEKDVDPEEN